MDKEGRPPASIAAWRSLHARNVMERRYPAVVALIDMLALENVDVASVTAAVEQAKAQLHEGRHRHQAPQKQLVRSRHTNPYHPNTR